MPDDSAQSYWKGNLKIVLSLMAVWFFISFVCGILLVDVLDSIRIGGFKLGFWIAQQGSIFVFVILVFIYIKLMDRLDAEYENSTSAKSHNKEGDLE